jgi:hypothetical protein
MRVEVVTAINTAGSLVSLMKPVELCPEHTKNFYGIKELGKLIL